MVIFDIFRHADDDEQSQELTLKGKRQIKMLAEQLRLVGIDYDYFISSPYPRCRATLELIMVELGISIEKIDSTVRLCTQRPKEWDELFYSSKFQKLLPLLGSKLETAHRLCAPLLRVDAEWFLQELIRVSRRVVRGCILGVSHNTMILAAASLVVENRLISSEFKNLQCCQGVRFILKNNKFIAKKIILPVLC